ncbi:hypothetical protein B0H12DRAFT_706552 [Mycena haematopus]|nr:hypothetical protein B0H12DRAFT_706552 [Mycena haematopus]
MTKEAQLICMSSDAVSVLCAYSIDASNFRKWMRAYRTYEPMMVVHDAGTTPAPAPPSRFTPTDGGTNTTVLKMLLERNGNEIHAQGCGYWSCHSPQA